MECEGEGGKTYAPIAREGLMATGKPKSPIRFLVMHAPSAVWQLIAGNYAEFSGGFLFTGARLARTAMLD